jgi:hypothetical protein
MSLFPAFHPDKEFLLPFPYDRELTVKEELESYLTAGLLTDSKFKVTDRSLFKAWLWLTSGLQPTYAPLCSQLLRVLQEKDSYKLEHSQISLKLTPEIFGFVFTNEILLLKDNLLSPTSTAILSNPLARVPLLCHYFKAWSIYLTTKESLLTTDYATLIATAKDKYSHYNSNALHYHVVKLKAKFQKLPIDTIAVLTHCPLIDSRNSLLVSSAAIHPGLPQYEYLTTPPKAEGALADQLYHGLFLPTQEQHSYLKSWLSQLTELVDQAILSKDPSELFALFKSIYRDYVSKFSLYYAPKQLTDAVLTSFGIAYVSFQNYKLPFLFSHMLTETNNGATSGPNTAFCQTLTSLILTPLSLAQPSNLAFDEWLDHMQSYELPKKPKYTQTANTNTRVNTACYFIKSAGFEYTPTIIHQRKVELTNLVNKFISKLAPTTLRAHPGIKY